MTPFKDIYNTFFSKITDDMYIELTEADTRKDCQLLLIQAIPWFEFPRQSLQYELVPITPQGEDNSYFVADLTSDEINILAMLMVKGWLQRQITSIENTAQKYYGNGFKLTSQASHLGKLLDLKEELKGDIMHLQRLYKRRYVDKDGIVRSSWSMFNTYND